MLTVTGQLRLLSSFANSALLRRGFLAAEPFILILIIGRIIPEVWSPVIEALLLILWPRLFGFPPGVDAIYDPPPVHRLPGAALFIIWKVALTITMPVEVVPK
jgi:hypothetical protein